MIFIVDDDDTVRDSLRVLLEAAGHAVEDFPSAQTFLAAAAFGGHDCVVVDIHMPGMTGVELLDSLRTSGNHIPVIVVTGQPNPAMTARAQAAGAFAILEKPFQPAEVLRLINDATKG